MIQLTIMEHLLWWIRHFLTPLQYHPVCHFTRVHFINPPKHGKWVTVAHLRCTIKAPAIWYRSP